MRLFLMLLVLLIAKFSVKVFAEDNKSQHELSKARTIVVGVPENQHKAFMASMEKTEKKFKLIRTARRFYKAANYQKALDLLLEALSYSNPNTMDAWNVRGGLADVYEAMGKKEEFINEINWLIENSRNETTTKAFIERKQRFFVQNK